jgi:gas vesicle protein
MKYALLIALLLAGCHRVEPGPTPQQAYDEALYRWRTEKDALRELEDRHATIEGKCDDALSRIMDSRNPEVKKDAKEFLQKAEPELEALESEMKAQQERIDRARQLKDEAEQRMSR